MVTYEWKLETLDEHGDIIDTDFSDSLTIDFFNASYSSEHDLCLVRSVRSSFKKSHAYVVDGKLKNYSETNCKPVKRFFKELKGIAETIKRKKNEQEK